MRDAAALRAAGEQRPAPRSGQQNGFLEQSVEDIARLEARDRIAMSLSHRVADRIAALGGSMPFAIINVIWFAIWVLVNSGVLFAAFDPYPFGLLTFFVSLEAIFLAIFVLMAQNRQAMQADRRAKIDLQINAISEQEVTKIMRLVREIHEHLGIQQHDPELEQMQKPTYVEDIADAVDDAQRRHDADAADGPDSAIDTEA